MAYCRKSEVRSAPAPATPEVKLPKRRIHSQLQEPLKRLVAQSRSLRHLVQRCLRASATPSLLAGVLGPGDRPPWNLHRHLVPARQQRKAPSFSRTVFPATQTTGLGKCPSHPGSMRAGPNLRNRAPDRRAPRQADPPRQHPRDERRELPPGTKPRAQVHQTRLIKPSPYWPWQAKAASQPPTIWRARLSGRRLVARVTPKSKVATFTPPIGRILLRRRHPGVTSAVSRRTGASAAIVDSAVITSGTKASSKATYLAAHSGVSAHPFRQHPPTRTGLSAHL